MTDLCACGCGESAWSADNPYARGHEPTREQRAEAHREALRLQRAYYSPKVNGKLAKRQRVKERKAAEAAGKG